MVRILKRSIISTVLFNTVDIVADCICMFDTCCLVGMMFSRRIQNELRGCFVLWLGLTLMMQELNNGLTEKQLGYLRTAYLPYSFTAKSAKISQSSF